MRTPFLLSSAGSTRATAYDFGNKSITLNGKTHVTWLDAVAKVFARTYDHATDTWSEAFYVDDGYDNHTNPTLTVDRDGHLRIAYGPHGYWVNWNYARFRYRRSLRPNDASAWSGASDFGYGATYASMIQLPCGLDAIGYRGGEAPSPAMFQCQRTLGHWTTAKAIFRQDIAPQYTHVGPHLAVDSKGRIYYGAHFYNVGAANNDPVNGNKAIMRSWGVALAMTPDQGETWVSMAGDTLNVPVPYSASVSVPPHGEDYRCGGVVIDRADRPWVLCWDATGTRRSLVLNGWTGQEWTSCNVATLLPAGLTPVYACMTIDTQGSLHIACTAMDMSVDAANAWGHVSSEVFHIVADSSGAPRSCRQVSTPDAAVCNWLPSISKPGPFCPIEKPVILYTHGVPGVGCLPETTTEVYCVLPD